MTIKLTKIESEKFFYNALCNGLHYLSQYGCEVDYNKKDYTAAKKRLEKNPSLMIEKNNRICYEDVMLEILKGGKTLICKNEDYSADSIISLKDVHERVQKTQANHLMNMINENDDADTADVILQTVFYKDIVFG